MCENLINNVELTQKFLLKYLEILSRDKVVDTKIALLELIEKMLCLNEYKENSIVKHIISNLICSKSRMIKEKIQCLIDVFSFIKESQIIEVVNSNGEFTNNMAYLKQFGVPESLLPISLIRPVPKAPALVEEPQKENQESEINEDTEHQVKDDYS